MKHVLVALLATTVFAASAQAQQQHNQKIRPAYNYAGVKYFTQDLDFDNGAECTQDGIFIDGSLDINGAVFAHGSYGDVSGDGCGSSTLTAGVGYRSAWGETSHLYGTLAFTDTSVDAGNGDSGLVLGGGIRGFVVPGIEGYFEVEHSTAFDKSTVANFGGAYWVNKDFSATLDIGFGSDQRSFAIGARISF